MSFIESVLIGIFIAFGLFIGILILYGLVLLFSHYQYNVRNKIYCEFLEKGKRVIRNYNTVGNMVIIGDRRYILSLKDIHYNGRQMILDLTPQQTSCEKK